MDKLGFRLSADTHLLDSSEIVNFLESQQQQVVQAIHDALLEARDETPPVVMPVTPLTQLRRKIAAKLYDMALELDPRLGEY